MNANVYRYLEYCRLFKEVQEMAGKNCKIKIPVEAYKRAYPDLMPSPDDVMVYWRDKAAKNGTSIADLVSWIP